MRDMQLPSQAFGLRKIPHYKCDDSLGDIRLLALRVRLDFTLPPVCLKLGHSPSHAANCFTLGHLLKSVPNSLTSV